MPDYKQLIVGKVVGAPGPQGPQGIPGKDGANGADGKQGPVGPAGADGKSPYQVAVEEGYTGTEAEFYAALVSLKNAPFLPISGGIMDGPIRGIQKAVNEDEPVRKVDALSTKTAALFGLGTDAVPDDVFDRIHTRSLFLKVGTYTGTGLFGKDNPNVIEVDGVPKFLIVTQYTFSTGDLYLSRLITGSLADKIIAVTHNTISEVRDEKFVVVTSFSPPSADKKGRVEWYSLESADAQLNTDGAHYMALVLCDGRGRFT